MKHTFMTAIVLVLLPFFASADITGPARVIDGDTLEINDVRVRLYGIDTPEATQDCRTEQGFPFACGDHATTALTDLIAGREVSCDPLDTDRYGRVVARCSVVGQDIGAVMVGAGLAVAYRRYSMDYVPLEVAAQTAGAGFWSADMQRPADYRAAARVTPNAPDAGCAIKGNVSDNGRIYHVPGQRYYDATSIDMDRGERWFCSAEEAEEAGWRASRV